MKRNLIIFVVALPFIISFAVLIASNHSVPAADSPLPNPNGYNMFNQAAQLLQGDPGPYETMSESELVVLVNTNIEPLVLVRSAVTNECRVPVQYSASFVSANLHDLAAFKKLAQTMTAEGRLAELRNHPAEAAQDYLDVIHFGMESEHGGFMVDTLVGIAIEEMRRAHLENLVNGLDVSSCRAIATTLESLDSHRQTWGEILQKDNILRRRISDGPFTYLVRNVFMHKQLSASINKAEMKFHDQQRKTGSLAVQFAARAYELDKSKPPTSIADLVPAYLKAVPKDPTTGKDMVYPP